VEIEVCFMEVLPLVQAHLVVRNYQGGVRPRLTT